MEFGMGAASSGWGLLVPKCALNVVQNTSLGSCAHTALCGLQTAFPGFIHQGMDSS